MKKIISLLAIILCLMIGISANADSWHYTWSTSVVEVPLNGNINDYINKPKAYLYHNDTRLNDAEITIMNEGDWLYYLSDVDTSKCGDYKVWYKAYETKYRPGTCLGYKTIITFRVKDTISPSIDFYKDEISIRRGTSFNPIDNAIVVDNYSKECQVMCLSTINYNMVGDYEAIVAALDEAGNKTVASYIIHVYETSAPTLTYIGAESFISAELNESLDLKKYFTAEDEIDGDISSLIKAPIPDTSAVGDMYYTVSVKNKAGLEDSYEIMVRTADSSIPMIMLKTSSVVIDYNENINDLDLRCYVESVIDNGESIPISNLMVEANLKHEVGKYQAIYTYNDGINTATATLDISIISSVQPKILCSTITAYVSEYPNLYDYVDVLDSSDPNIANSLVIYDDEVDYETAGKYSIEIYAINSSGIEAIKKANVIIKDNAVSSVKNYDYAIYIGLGVVIIGLGVALAIVLIKRKKEKNSI